ncbi:MAG TPA: hypothetical protein DCE78_03470 [Bacteroidetes bacterium]|nr:hypothetical protein [Bacteroidota bacterium]
MNDMSELLYLMAGMVLFSILVSNSNIAFVRNNTMLMESEYEYNAIAIAQSIIDEARVKPYDQADVVNERLLIDNDMPNFSAPSVLGPEGGESYPNFDDFDDFDGLNITRTNGLGDFTITATVTYINPNNLSVNTSVTTTKKELRVTVSHPNLPNTVTLTFLKTYY